MLNYPPPHSAPLFWLVSGKPCMESPNQYLSPEPSFARIAPTSFGIQGSKVCSTIRPLTLRHCFGWFQGNHVWKAPTSTFHQNLLLPGLLQPVSRSKGPKCARLSAPSLCATVLVGFKETMYGKPQPVPFTRTFFCQDCSNQFRDPRVQSVLDYPPPHCAPLFWLVSSKPCMESPNQYLSPEPSFARIAPTSFEIQGSKVCSTIRPLTLRHCFGWFQGNHVWKAPTSTFHQNLFLPGLLQPVSRSKGPKCARLSAPSLCATVLVGFRETMYGKPQPAPFTRTFFCQDCSNQFRDPRVQSVLDYPPPHSAPLFWLVSGKPCMESPNEYLSAEPFFARIAPTSFEIQGSKVCSTIRPLTLRHCFGWFQGNHVWKAPTSTFHQNLLLHGLLQPVSGSKGPKCARLSAPSPCATVLVGFRETMYGKPQPVPFTRTFFCQDCSNQFRDPRVQSVLHYPPPHSAPLFWLVSRKPCMESPNQYLSPEPSFARIAPTSFEIQGSKVCSTIRPLTLRHCFGWFQGNHVWKAPTSTFQQNLFLPGLLQPVLRSKGPKCAQLSAPSLCATVLVGFRETMYGKPQPVPFTRTFFCTDCSNQFRDPRVQSVLDYPPPHPAPLFWLVSGKPCMESPNQYLSPEPSFARIAPTSFEIQGSKVCSTIRPLHSAPLFWLVSRKPCMESPNQGPKCARLSAPFLFWLVSEPSFAKIAPTSFEIQGSKVCSTIRPLTLRHCFGWLLEIQGSKDYPPPQTMYGKIPFTGTFFCQDCSNQFRDPRVQSVLDYPPPHSAPLFWLVSGKPCITRTFFCQDCSNQFRDPRVPRVVSKEPCMERTTVLVGSYLSPNHVWKAPSLCATVLVGFRETMYGKPQPAPFTRTFFCQDCSNQFRDPRVQSVLDYPPPHSAPLFWLVSGKPCMESPNDPEPFFARIALTLRHSAPLFWLVSGKPCMETFMYGKPQGSKVCSTIRTCFGSPEPSFARIAPTSFEIQGPAPPGKPCMESPNRVPFTRTLESPNQYLCQDCSNQFRDPDYPPPPSAPCFGWFQENHVGKPQPVPFRDCSNQIAF